MPKEKRPSPQGRGSASWPPGTAGQMGIHAPMERPKKRTTTPAGKPSSYSRRRLEQPDWLRVQGCAKRTKNHGRTFGVTLTRTTVCKLHAGPAQQPTAAVEPAELPAPPSVLRTVLDTGGCSIGDSLIWYLPARLCLGAFVGIDRQPAARLHVRSFFFSRLAASDAKLHRLLLCCWADPVRRVGVHDTCRAGLHFRCEDFVENPKSGCSIGASIGPFTSFVSINPRYAVRLHHL